MVDVIGRMMLALIALALAIPPAAALPDPDDLVATEGPPLPDLLPEHDPDDVVRIHVKDTDGGAEAGAEAGGNEVQMRAQCAQGATGEQAACGGTVCFFQEGYGALPVYVVDPAEGIGAGADVGWILDLVGPGDPDGADGPSEESGAEEPSGGYGPYDGVKVSPEGHCGP